MAEIRGTNGAFGAPGRDGSWSAGDKSGVGTAYAASSRVWYTIWNGIITEVYYPTADSPQIGELQFLITDGHSFVHQEKCDLDSKHTVIEKSTGYLIENTDPDGRYVIEKEIIADPQLACVLQHTRIKADAEVLKELSLFAYCTPHLAGAAQENSGFVAEIAGQWILVAEHEGVWLALGCTVPFSQMSCGYVGASDGLTDLQTHKNMEWNFDCATKGTVALTGRIDIEKYQEFTLGLAIGKSMRNACTTLLQSLAQPFDKQKGKFVEQWTEVLGESAKVVDPSSQAGRIYDMSCAQLLAHEDKMFPGALIASLSIPWGEARSAESTGGYHLVWGRDLVESAIGLLAAGHAATPLRSIIYLSANQNSDGGFPQNFFIDGQPYWTGIQLDEVAYPLILARLLFDERDEIPGFHAQPLLSRAARFLILHGPVTEQERWEECSGYSPSTLAVCIAGLITVARGYKKNGDHKTAKFIEEYADWLESHIDLWTVTTNGALVDGITRYHIRIAPAAPGSPQLVDGVDGLTLQLPNLQPGSQNAFPAQDVVDTGFLELVRHGIRRPDDPIIVDTLKVVDSILKVETASGPAWRRYNHDGYGQRDDGSAFTSWGVGRVWPLLVGERGHYEMMAGNDAAPYLAAMEKMASETGLLPEQIWDASDIPDKGLFNGGATGSARPLCWAHAEYVRLLRSIKDGKVFGMLPEVEERYLHNEMPRDSMEIWSPNYPLPAMKPGVRLRIQADSAFRLRWSLDNWRTFNDTQATTTSLDIDYVDINITKDQSEPVRFTFFWTNENRWDGSDFCVDVRKRAQEGT